MYGYESTIYHAPECGCTSQQGARPEIRLEALLNISSIEFLPWSVAVFLLPLQVAFTLVQLARLTLHKFLSDMKNANSEVATYYLARAKQLSNDSIRFYIQLFNFLFFFILFELLVFVSQLLLFAKFMCFFYLWLC